MSNSYEIKLKTKLRAEAEIYCRDADNDAPYLWIIEAPEFSIEDGEWEIWFYVEMHRPKVSTPFIRTQERVIRRPCPCGAPATGVDLHGNDACETCSDGALQWESKRI